MRKTIEEQQRLTVYDATGRAYTLVVWREFLNGTEMSGTTFREPGLFIYRLANGAPVNPAGDDFEIVETGERLTLKPPGG